MAGESSKRSVLRELVIGIAEQPPLAGFCRSNHRMTALFCVLRGVAVGRVVAAQCDAALLAGPEVYPFRSDLHTLLAFPALRLFDGVHGADVLASLSWHGFLTAEAPDEQRRSQSTLHPPPMPHA